MINIINSFDQIKLKRNSLVLSDIDETILRFDPIDGNWWRRQFDFHYQINKDYNAADTYASEKWIEIVTIHKPSHTDSIGFFRLIERIKRSDSCLEFVTARNTKLIPYTQKHFEDLNLNYMDWVVHHLSGKSKGQYIQSNFKLNEYDHVIFIDDLDNNLQSVLDNVIHPSLSVYKFITHT
jgi:hypothetical protein